ncbi:MAG: cytochrome c [Myxococcota bacterium]|nr:cytochrome c [Myxococcota bacterium]
MHLVISLVCLLVAGTAVFLARHRLGLFWSAAIFFVATVAFAQYGFEPAAPASVVKLYAMGVFVALAMYVTSSDAALEQFWGPIEQIMVDPSKKFVLWALLVLLPGVVAWQTYESSLPATEPPPKIRSVHPAPPNTIDFQAPGDSESMTFDVVNGDSPIRALETSDPEKFAEHVANGKDVYYENCFYCHGDYLAADGHYADAVSPPPANFQDKGTLAMLQEAFLFWRVAKGGPGLPSSGTPWDSSMPAWEKFLTEEEIWDVIAFLYEYTGFSPRAGGGHGDGAHGEGGAH